MSCVCLIEQGGAHGCKRGALIRERVTEQKLVVRHRVCVCVCEECD